MPLLFLRSFSFFFEEKNVFTYLHCYRMRHDFSEGAAFLRGDSEPPSNGRKEDINTCNGSHNSSPRSEERVVGALPPRALGSGPGLCLHELTVSPASEQRHFLPGRCSLGVRRLPSGASAPAIPQRRCLPAWGKQAGSAWGDETAPWDQTEAEFRGPVLGRWLWGALPQLGGKRMGIKMRVKATASPWRRSDASPENVPSCEDLGRSAGCPTRCWCWKATERGGLAQWPCPTVEKPGPALGGTHPFPGLPGPVEAPHGPCRFPLVGLPEPTVGGGLDG